MLTDHYLVTLASREGKRRIHRVAYPRIRYVQVWDRRRWILFAILVVLAIVIGGGLIGFGLYEGRHDKDWYFTVIMGLIAGLGFLIVAHVYGLNQERYIRIVPVIGEVIELSGTAPREEVAQFLRTLRTRLADSSGQSNTTR